MQSPRLYATFLLWLLSELFEELPEVGDPEQVAAVESIRTVDGHQIFAWGGRWTDRKDTMHFQINVTPEELRRGLASPASGERELAEAELAAESGDHADDVERHRLRRLLRQQRPRGYFISGRPSLFCSAKIIIAKAV